MYVMYIQAITLENILNMLKEKNRNYSLKMRDVWGEAELSHLE